MKKKVFSLLLAAMLTFSMGTTAYATEDAIADMQAQKQEAEAGLAQAQANIDSLESKKQELENYLSDLNTQYEDLTNAISELSIQAGEKENELNQLHTELKKAKKALNKQYDDMKLRIQYMYENGGTSALTTLLSSKDLSEFLNNAENVAKISQYDRNMLEKCENLQNTIKDQETTAKEEKASIDELLAERASKQQEVQELAASTSDNISSYVSQISASQEEAAALTAEINNADNSIARLVQQAEEEKAAREAAQAEAEAAAAQEQSEEENSDSEDYEEDSYDTEESGNTYSEEESSEDTVSEDSYSEDSDSSYEESTDSSEDTSDSSASDDSQSSSESADSSQGKYLGNFTLTAYCNCAQCCGTAGNLTASGTVPTAGRTVAMAGVPFGTQLLINGNVYTVEDLGTPYGHVDIFFNNHSDALSFGLQSAEVYQLN
jgi:peptidoglycan hydrolase CwlO-like protein/3D (Asp-Asp-Asp) domain-containing protein